MKIIFTGGRNYKNKELTFYYLELFDPSDVVVGDCPTGLDSFVDEYCKANHIGFSSYFADWEKYGRAAGPIRNKIMCEENQDANFVLAFPGGKGTENCIKEAKKLGIHVLRVDE